MDRDPLVEPVPVDPDAPAMIGYTSGTTADPKGVVHTHHTLLAEVRLLASLNTLGSRAAVMASPLAHMTGMLGGSLVPLHLGNPIELIDRWDAGRVLAIMGAHNLSPGGGATIFLTSLLDHPDLGPEHLAAMPRFRSSPISTAPRPARSASAACATGCGPCDLLPVEDRDPADRGRSMPATSATRCGSRLSSGSQRPPKRAASMAATALRSTLPESSQGSWPSSVNTAMWRGTL